MSTEPNASAAADHHLLDLVRDAQVCPAVEGAHAVTLHAIHSRRRLGRGLEPVQDDVAAGPRPGAGCGEPEAAHRSGDQRALARERLGSHDVVWYGTVQGLGIALPSEPAAPAIALARFAVGGATSYDLTDFRARGHVDDRRRPVLGRDQRRWLRRQRFRTPWGDPDIQGSSRPTMSSACRSSGRSSSPGARRSSPRRSSRNARRRPARQAAADAEEFVAPRDGRTRAATAPARRRTGSSAGQPSRRTSIVIDPRTDASRISTTRRGSARPIAVNARTTGNRPFDGPDGDGPLRSLHHARAAPRDLPDHLQQHVADRAGPGLRRHPLRDDSRRARHPARRPAAAVLRDAAVLRRLARALGRRHAGRGGHELPDAHDQLPRRRWLAPS